MKERIVAGVRIQHHRIETMPRLVRLHVPATGGGSAARQPLDAARGIAIALLASGVFWIALVIVGS